MMDSQQHIDRNRAALGFEQHRQLSPYERMRENLAFFVDDRIDQRKLWGIDFRLKRSDLDELDERLGPETVLPLRKAITQSRCDGLFFSALKVVGQIGLTGSVALVPPENISIGDFIIPQRAIIPLAAGFSMFTNKMESKVRASNYYKVLDAARPVVEELFMEYEPNFWNFTDIEKRDSVKDAIRAIALGEISGFSEFSLATLTLLNAAILSQIDPNLIRSIDPRVATSAYLGGEAGVIAYLRYSAKMSGALHFLFDVLGDKVANAIHADIFFGTRLAERVQSDTAAQASRNRELAYQTSRNILFDTVASWSPLLADAVGAGDGLLFALLGQLSDQMLSGTESSRDLSEAQIGLVKLREVFETIRKLDISLIPGPRLSGYCTDFKSKVAAGEASIVAVESLATNSGFKAYFSHFEVKFGEDVSPKIIMEDPLNLQAGFYDISRAAGQPYSIFLSALAFRLRLKEFSQSYINIGEEDQVDWKEIHNLTPQEIRDYIVYIPSETSKFQVSTIAMFTDDVRDFLPVVKTSSENDDTNKFYIADLLNRYRSKGLLTPMEQEAVGQAVDYYIGLKNEKEIKAVKLSRQVKKIRDQLIRYLTPEAARIVLREHLESDEYKVEQKFKKKKFNPLFNKEELVAIQDTASFAKLNGAIRARLHILSALNKARTTETRKGAKVVLVDGAMDPVDDAYTERLLIWISKWIEKNKAAVFIATGEDRNKKIIRKVAPDMYRDSFSIIGPYVRVTPKEKA